MVPEEGFEPSVEDPKSPALPLGYSGMPGEQRLPDIEGPGEPGRTTPVRAQEYANPKTPEPSVHTPPGVTSGGLPAFSKSMRNALLAAALVLVTAACGAYVFPGSSSSGSGTVTGTVTAVPCAPVESNANPCMGRPVAGLEIDFSNGSTTSRTVTDSEGSYTIDLDSGTWKVAFKGVMRLISGPPTVTVSSGARVVANYVVDSGIRVPVPQQ